MLTLKNHLMMKIRKKKNLLFLSNVHEVQVLVVTKNETKKKKRKIV